MSSAPIAAAPAHILELARRVLEIEAEAVHALADRLGDDFIAAVGGCANGIFIKRSTGRVYCSVWKKQCATGTACAPAQRQNAH